MPYILVEDFRNGLDTRRMNVTATPGSLVTLTNAHITRGGEIEIGIGSELQRESSCLRLRVAR